MSIQLDWPLIQSHLQSHLLTTLRTLLLSSPPPSFLEPITITSFSLGTQPPQVSIVDVRDIYKEFQHPDLEVDAQLAAVSDALARDRDRDRGRPARQASLGSAAAMFGSQSIGIHSPYAGIHNSPPFLHSPRFEGGGNTPRFEGGNTPRSASSTSFVPPSAKMNDWPTLQLHFDINYTSDARLGIETALLVNFPSEAFMTLPLKLVLTQFRVECQAIVAVDGDKRMVHVSLTDQASPFASSHSKKAPPVPKQSFSSAENVAPPSPISRTSKQEKSSSRIIRSIAIESEVGDTSKHALRNVAVVEKFLTSLVQGAVEKELVFPNFYTIAL